MKFNLKNDIMTLHMEFKRRVREYPVYVNSGPGEDSDPIVQITLGYQFDQAGWASFVFDTRPNAEADGEWQSYIEENAIEFAGWVNICEELYENEGSVDVTQPNGKKVRLTTDDDLAESIGVAMKDLLIACRDEGMFDNLPLADNCKLTVEEHEGQYGWTARVDGREEETDDNEDGPFAVTDELKTRVGKLSKKKQIAFWIDRLEQIAADTKTHPYDVFGDRRDTIDELEAIGKASIAPMLQLGVKLSGKTQFQGDGKQARELCRSSVLESLIEKVEEMEHSTPEIEKLLRQIVTKAVKVNQDRKLWGAAAFFAATALFNLFPGYPCPELGSSDNKLIDPKPFVGAKK
jgi:hypothetical protein